jgi:hypothetical protein
VKFVLLFALLASLQACGFLLGTTYPKDHVTSFMESSEVLTAFFNHRTSLYLSRKNETTLKVFIEGDGRPWVGGKNIRLDPSPQRLLAMELLLNTSGDRLYLGRPCYFQTNDKRCHFKYWTSDRYSHEIINSMANIIEQKMLDGSYQNLLIIGHSGGGTIAALLACKTTISPSIITLAANLDIQRWAETHSWSTLTGSQNPANLPSNCKKSNAYHFYGDEDENVPAISAQKFFIEGKSQRFIIEGADHQNWPLFWVEIKAMLAENSDLNL